MYTSIKKIIPIMKWVVTGGLAVLVDIVCLFLLVEFAHIHYLLSTSIAFFISASTNYTLSRVIIFFNGEHSIQRSYVTFMCISLIGLGAITIGMFIFVDVFHLHYLLSRLTLAGTLGVSSFFLHKYISFKDTTTL